MTVTIGIVAILITAFGCFSNWLNWRFLNYRPVRLLYYIGALVHESSHALLCLVTGAKITEFKAFSTQPHVTHGKPRLPLIGKPLISLAPIAGGLAFMYLVSHFLLASRFSLPIPSSITDIRDVAGAIFHFISQFDPIAWQSWVMALLMLNAGAMIGPSPQDLKNIWPALLILLFIPCAPIVSIGIAALGLIIVNIFIQLILASFSMILRKL